MNKAQLIEKLSTQLGSKKAATDAVEAVVDTITRAVASGERVAITGFGAFEKVARPARTGRNPRTGQSVKIKKTSVPKFKAGQAFKEVVSGARKLEKVAVSAVRSAAGGGTARKTAAKKTTAKKTTAKKTTAKKTTAKKTTARPAAKKTVAKKVTVKKVTSTRPQVRALARKVTTTTPAKRSVAKKVVAKKAPAKKVTAKKTAARRA